MNQTRTPGRFGFLLHPLDMADVIRFEPKAANKRMALVERILDWMPAHVGSDIHGVESHTGVKTDGWFITIPMLPHHFIDHPRDKVMAKIIQGGKLAQEKGASIVGLGAYTSVVGDAGITVANNLDIAVTSGSSYTVATAIEGAMLAAQRMGIELSQARVAVVGASGSIGSVCAHMIARHVKSLTLVARSLIRLKRVAESIHSETGLCPTVACDMTSGLSDADLIITATSSTGNIIRPHDLKPGAVVCDVSMPHDTCREVAAERPDVLVIEGGLVEVPGDNVALNYDIGYPPKVALACMAETMILALEGRFENFSLGRGIRREQVEEITGLARKHGFRLAGFRSFNRLVTDAEVDCIRREAVQRRKAVTYSISEAVERTYRMKTIVSVSLGSSARDHEAEAEWLGERFVIRRVGTDGDFRKALALLAELDGTVDAIGLGGVDVYLYSRNQRYALRDGLRLMNAVKKTPVVDGSGLKNTLERHVVAMLGDHPDLGLRGSTVLMVCAMDRFGMAEALEAIGCKVTYGDLIFALDKDQPITSLAELEERADKLLPEVCKLPISFLYPIGKQQDKATDAAAVAKYAHYYEENRVLAGDYHFVRKYLPPRLEGQTVLTNTITRKDVDDLRNRGARWLVTTTPELGGRSFGTNVLEACLLALLGKTWDEVTPEDYLTLIKTLDLKPRIEALQPAAQTTH